MPGRKFSGSSSYRYGFNGKEEDDEVKGDGNQQDYGMRIYDGRLGRFLSVDPISKSYPMLTPYQFASNRPIDGVDQDGLEYLPYMRSIYRLSYITTTYENRTEKGSLTTVNSETIVNIQYENVPNRLIKPGLAGLRGLAGGPATANGRDWNSQKDGPIVSQIGDYYNPLPEFYGADNQNDEFEPTASTKGVPYGYEGPTPATGAEGLKEAAEIGLNYKNLSYLKARNLEANYKQAFYNATNTVDEYFKNNKVFGLASSGSDRADLINFVTDGYLRTDITETFKGQELTNMRLNQYRKQLSIAWYGLQIISNTPNAEIQKRTANQIDKLLKLYKADGGGNEFDTITKFYKK